jgi:hypothetical protein
MDHVSDLVQQTQAVVPGFQFCKLVHAKKVNPETASRTAPTGTDFVVSSDARGQNQACGSESHIGQPTGKPGRQPAAGAGGQTDLLQDEIRKANNNAACHTDKNIPAP